jgi:hypothetical protein
LSYKDILREYDTVARADNYFAEYRMLFSRRRGNERDIFEIALDGTSLFRGSCIDVIKSRLRKNLKAPASSRIIPFLKGEIRRRKKCSGRLKELDRNVGETEVDQTDADQTDANHGTDYKDICWQDGRRIVELKLLAEQLNACDGCDSPLNLMNIEQERLHGFGSYLSIRCAPCNLLNTVVTNKTHPGRKGPAIFDINTKTAIGKYTNNSGTFVRFHIHGSYCALIIHFTF